MPILSPNEAAKQSGVSRRSIMRAIEAGELAARRDNRNQWQIEAESLAHWARTGPAQVSAQPAPTPDRRPEAINTDLLVQSLRELIEAERRRADASESDRDAWRGMAERLVEENRELMVLARRPWWKRLAS